MEKPNPHYQHAFQRLIDLQGTEEGERLFADLLKESPHFIDPLDVFIRELPDTAALCVLIDLLGKTMDRRAVPVLVRLLDSENPDVRRQSAIGLGWLQAVQALQALDHVEGHDPDERVRQEASAAIEEILRDFPKQRETLMNHVPFGEEVEEVVIPSPEDADHAALDEEARRRLLVALPRLLARQFEVVPLHLDLADGTLTCASALSGDRSLAPRLGEAIGRPVVLHPASHERVRLLIDELYIHGDDDFVQFNEELTPETFTAARVAFLESLRTDEPAAPLTEANDGCEAVQFLVATCAALDARDVTIKATPTTLLIGGQRLNDEPFEVEPPLPELWNRFVEAVLILWKSPASARPPADDLRTVRLPSAHPPVVLHRASDLVTADEVKCRIRFEREDV